MHLGRVTFALRTLAIAAIVGGIAVIVAWGDTPTLRMIGAVTSIQGGILLVLVAIEEAHQGHQHHAAGLAAAVRYGQQLEREERTRDQDGDDLA